MATATVWGVRTWQNERALAGVTSVASGLGVKPGPPTQADGVGRHGTADSGEPVLAEPMAAAPAATDRLPPLVLPGQPVPQAVLRDLPEWVAAELGPVQTSGASGDETAAAAAPATVAPVAAASASQRQRAAAPPRADRTDRTSRYGATFARCPGPGESGAVECRRAVCAGAARKSAACAPYLE